MKLTQPQRTLLAIVFTIAFLITGKVFIFTKQTAANTQTNDPNGAIAELQQSETVTTILTTTTSTTTTTTTTAITDHFELVPPDASVSETGSETALTTETTAVTDITETEPAETTAETPDDTGASEAPADYFSDALFIGDSRTVGQAFYSPIDGATYFATVGLATYKIDDAVSEVPGTEGMSFATVLSMKQYSKIYIMLGINELGNDLSYTMQNFRNLITRVQTAQPGAIVILEANLHVAASRHNTDNIVNNTVINNFNAGLAALADNQTVFYIDVNPIFDDAYGCLNEAYTSDGTHPYAKHYAEWETFLRQHAIVK